METIKVGILGAGSIANKMADTLRRMEGVEAYAVASRELLKAEEFASRWGIPRAYGSYEEMLEDVQVQLVYVATPHSHHYQHARMSLLSGKAVFCEKAFTANARQAEELIALSLEKQLFLAEAIWTRYMPVSQKINEVIASGIIGRPMMLTANLGYPVSHKERLRNPALAGGALLDLGVYPINFASMVFGPNVKEVISSCTKNETGMDAQDTITLIYEGGEMAVLCCSMLTKTDRQGVISGDKGYIVVDNINVPQHFTVYSDHCEQPVQYDYPFRFTGFEYQVEAVASALRNAWIETPYMPQAETLRIMRLMDGLREEWGVRFPFES